MTKWLRTKKAIRILGESGLPFTKVSLIVLGIRNGFARKCKDNFHWEYDKEAMLAFFQNTYTAVIPKGYLSVKEIAEKEGLPIGKIYSILKEHEISTKITNKRRYILYKEIKPWVEEEKNKK